MIRVRFVSLRTSARTPSERAPDGRSWAGEIEPRFRRPNGVRDLARLAVVTFAATTAIGVAPATAKPLTPASGRAPTVVVPTTDPTSSEPQQCPPGATPDAETIPAGPDTIVLPATTVPS